MTANQLGDINKLIKSPNTSIKSRVSIHNELQKPYGKFLFISMNMDSQPSHSYSHNYLLLERLLLRLVKK